MNFQFVFCCHATNHPKVHGLKQHSCIIGVFMGQESRTNFTESSAQGFTRLKLTYWLGPGSHLRFKILLQTHVVVDTIHFLTAVELMAAPSSRLLEERI